MTLWIKFGHVVIVFDGLEWWRALVCFLDLTVITDRTNCAPLMTLTILIFPLEQSGMLLLQKHTLRGSDEISEALSSSVP